MFVLSPKAAETRRFWENDALFRDEFAFRASYLSGTDLAPLAAPGRSDLEVGMTDAAMDRLLTLPTFRAYITRRETEVAAKAEAEGEARGEARALMEGFMDALLTYFAAKGDTPSAAGFAALRACGDPAIMRSWLQRAYSGATSAQILENLPKPGR